LVKKKVFQLKPFIESILPAKFDDIVEYDEIWTFVGSKLNRQWLWIALCRRTKQVIAYHFGDRDKKSFLKLYEKVPIDYANCLSRSDGLHAYKILTKYGHKMCKQKNGTTSQVEAFNTILRQRLARLVRKTCAFSKSFEMHKKVIRWFIQEYNENINSVAL
jgi:insertion element IS1 protein InsB